LPGYFPSNRYRRTISATTQEATRIASRCEIANRVEQNLSKFSLQITNRRPPTLIEMRLPPRGNGKFAVFKKRVVAGRQAEDILEDRSRCRNHVEIQVVVKRLRVEFGIWACKIVGTLGYS
jgi:hypothetical protein